VHDPQVSVGRVLPRVVVDRGVVDEHVQGSECGRDLVTQPIDGRLFGHVEAARQHAIADLQLLRGGLTLAQVARAEHDGVTEVRELPGDLEPDAPVGAGDDSNAFLRHE